MSSPDRMEMHARAIADLVQAMSLMEAEQQSQDERLRALNDRVLAQEEWRRGHEEWRRGHEEWRRAHEEWVRAHEEWMRGNEEWMDTHNQWARGIQVESRRNRERISEIIGALTNIQADIARLDAAS